MKEALSGDKDRKLTASEGKRRKTKGGDPPHPPWRVKKWLLVTNKGTADLIHPRPGEPPWLGWDRGQGPIGLNYLLTAEWYDPGNKSFFEYLLLSEALSIPGFLNMSHGYASKRILTFHRKLFIVLIKLFWASIDPSLKWGWFLLTFFLFFWWGWGGEGRRCGETEQGAG